jgi:polysaccharide export outer membrane protein
MRSVVWALVLAAVLVASGCTQRETLSAGKIDTPGTAPTYQIGPGDSMQIFVWRNQDLTTSVSVRPDGRITVPLVEDLEAAGKTPTELAKDIEGELAKYVQDPLVTVIMTGFVGTYQQQVRVVGAAANPQSLPYRDGMTLLDVMVSVGGLTEFAAGDRATLVRVADGEQKAYRVEIDSLVRDGEISANVAMLPGDILIIPETFL